MSETDTANDLDDAVDRAMTVPEPPPQADVAGPTPSLDNAVIATPSSSPAPDQLTPIGITNFELSRTRQNLAYRLLWIMIGVIVVFVFVSLAYGLDCLNARDGCTAQTQALNLITTSLAPIFTAMVGLVGSVIGFYFGSSKSGSG